MAILFFSLRGVPDDEAEDIRELLTSNEIDFYETSAGNWGISMPAIWLYQQDDLEKAQALFAEYQHQRAIVQRELYQQLKQQGKAKNFLHHNMKKPLQFVIYSGLILLTGYISIKWLFELGL